MRSCWIMLLLSYCSGDRIEKMTWEPKIRTEQPTKTTIVMLGHSRKRFDNLETILIGFHKTEFS